MAKPPKGGGPLCRGQLCGPGPMARPLHALVSPRGKGTRRQHPLAGGVGSLVCEGLRARRAPGQVLCEGFLLIQAQRQLSCDRLPPHHKIFPSDPTNNSETRLHEGLK